MASLLSLALAATAAAQASAEGRPNIVVFLVDDLGWQDSSVVFDGAPNALHARYRTPHLAALAARGMRFGNAHAHCVCSPTRTSLLTGQHPARHRVTQWTLHAGRDPSGRTEHLSSPSSWRTDGLQPEDVTLPALLRDAGYTTIHAGKAHWGANGTAGSDPRTLGFDVNIGGHAAGGPGSYSGLDGFGAAKPPWAVPGLERYHGLPVHLTDATTAEALRSVDAAIDADRPFYLHLAHYAVHVPLAPHDPFAAGYRERGLDETEARYASMIEGVDHSLGALIAHLERRGIADRTLIVYASDNGGLAAHGRGTLPDGIPAGAFNHPLRAGKGSAYEGGTRVPMVIAWGAQNADHPLQARLAVRAGARCDAPVISEDIFPTVLSWAGLTAPTTHPVDGRDLTQLLGGKPPDPAATQRPLVFHYPHVWSNGIRSAHPEGGYEPHSAINAGGWKAIYFYEPGRWELYDLRSDLGERRDLASTEPSRLAVLAARLVRYLDDRDAPYPELRDGGAARIALPRGASGAPVTPTRNAARERRRSLRSAEAPRPARTRTFPTRG